MNLQHVSKKDLTGPIKDREIWRNTPEVGIGKGPIIITFNPTGGAALKFSITVERILSRADWERFRKPLTVNTVCLQIQVKPVSCKAKTIYQQYLEMLLASEMD